LQETILVLVGCRSSPHCAKRRLGIELYGRQLPAYAFAPENPDRAGLGVDVVTRLGLYLVEPCEFVRVDRTRHAWVEVPLDEEAFIAFVAEVLAVLGSPELPPPGSSF
jgi:hypothetical protein